MIAPAVFIRPLERAEWEAFREIRLRALKTEPGSFCATYAAWATRSPAEWQDHMAGPGHQVFGLFDGAQLIGITGVVSDRDDPSGETALLVMSYILPEYRGRGLAGLLHEARLGWIRARPQCKRIAVSHRESNEASRRVLQGRGFRYVRRTSRQWPDGVTEDELHYELCDFHRP